MCIYECEGGKKERGMEQRENCVRKCKKVGEIAVMEFGSGRVPTKGDMEVRSSAGPFKRRKLMSGVDRVQLVNHRYHLNEPEKSMLPATTENLDHILVSLCSSNESSVAVKQELRSVDLEVESYAEGSETEISTLVTCRFSRETTPSSEVCADTDEMEYSTATKPSEGSRRRTNPVVKMPPAAEIEEFFSAAEKYEQKRFADKYNYDIVKDVPLEGPYQWVRLKP